MTNSRLNINLSRLWEPIENTFTIRFTDLNQAQQLKLAKRIKAIAPQYTIRKTSGNGATIEMITNILNEINPIIFSEGECQEGSWQSRYSSFSCYSTANISGYRFKDLCQIIYKLLYSKKPLTQQIIYSIVNMTSISYTKNRDFINNLFPNGYQALDTGSQQRLTLIQDLGMDDVTQARMRIMRNGSDSIPEGMRSYEPEPDENDEDQNILVRSCTEEEVRNTLIDSERGQIPAAFTAQMVNTLRDRIIRSSSPIRTMNEFRINQDTQMPSYSINIEETPSQEMRDTFSIFEELETLPEE